MKFKKLILITSFIMVSSQVDAQFNKFKSRTDFKANNEADDDFDEAIEEDFDPSGEDQIDDNSSVDSLKKDYVIALAPEESEVEMMNKIKIRPEFQTLLA